MTATLLPTPHAELALEAPAPRGGRLAWAGRTFRIETAVPLLPAVLMLVVGLVGLDRHSVWRDEAASLVAARRSLPELWAMLGHTETVHALYYTLLHGWLQLGSGEVWARIPSVLAMAVAAGLVAVIGRRVASATVGLVAGLLVVANPSASFYAQEARSTALVAAVALLCTWFLLRAVDGRRSWWTGYALAGVVLVGLNALAVLVLLAHAVTLLWWRQPRRALGRWTLAVLPSLALTCVLGLVSSSQPYTIGWIAPPGTSSVREFAGLTLGPTRPLLVVLAGLVLLGAWPVRSAPGRRLRALALPVFALPTTVLLTASFVVPVFVPRYVFPSVAGAALLGALGIGRLARVVARGRGAGRVAAAVTVLALLAVAALGLGAQRHERTPASRPDDLAAAAAVLAAQARPGDAVLFLPSNRRLVALVYPQAFVGVRDVALAEDPVAAQNLVGRSAPVPAVLAGIDASQRVWAVGRPGLELLASETVSRAELDQLERDFVPTRTSEVDGVGVTLFERRATSP